MNKNDSFHTEREELFIDADDRNGKDKSKLSWKKEKNKQNNANQMNNEQGQVGQWGATGGSSNECVTDMHDRQTDQPTNGHSQL